jgi:hypothetical protein
LAAQPDSLILGGPSSEAAALRQDWQVQEEGLLKVSATIVADATKSFTPIPTDGNGRSQSDPLIWRHTLLLTGDGHAADDLSAQTLLDQSHVGWQRAYGKSLKAALNVKKQLTPLDQPWERPSLQTDWLTAWSDLVPKDRLQPPQRN